MIPRLKKSHSSPPIPMPNYSPQLYNSSPNGSHSYYNNGYQPGLQIIPETNPHMHIYSHEHEHEHAPVVHSPPFHVPQQYAPHFTNVQPYTYTEAMQHHVQPAPSNSSPFTTTAYYSAPSEPIVPVQHSPPNSNSYLCPTVPSPAFQSALPTFANMSTNSPLSPPSPWSPYSVNQVTHKVVSPIPLSSRYTPTAL
jgi:hypothetical protein